MYKRHVIFLKKLLKKGYFLHLELQNVFNFIEFSETNNIKKGLKYDIRKYTLNYYSENTNDTFTEQKKSEIFDYLS